MEKVKEKKIKVLNCRHYKGDNYTYNLPDNQKLNLCMDCEMHLLMEMKKQEVMENKMQVKVNEHFEEIFQKKEDEVNKGG